MNKRIIHLDYGKNNVQVEINSYFEEKQKNWKKDHKYYGRKFYKKHEDNHK